MSGAEILEKVLPYAGLAALLWNIFSYCSGRKSTKQLACNKNFSDTILKEFITPFVIGPLISKIETLLICLETNDEQTLPDSFKQFQSCLEDIRGKAMLLTPLDATLYTNVMCFLDNYEDKITEETQEILSETDKEYAIAGLKSNLLGGFTYIVAAFTLIISNTNLEKICSTDQIRFFLQPE